MSDIKEGDRVPNVEDLTEPPIVGRFYMVPCVFGTSDRWQIESSKRWLPVSGPMHSDAEYIGFAPLHYHYDHRFTPMKEWKELLLCSDPMFIVVNDPGSKIEHRRMLCRRTQRDYPNAHFHRALSEAYEDKRVTCGKCPHRGLPLLSLPRDGHGNVTCPGHGLRWNIETGRLVRSEKPCP